MIRSVLGAWNNWMFDHIHCTSIAFASHSLSLTPLPFSNCSSKFNASRRGRQLAAWNKCADSGVVRGGGGGGGAQSEATGLECAERADVAVADE